MNNNNNHNKKSKMNIAVAGKQPTGDHAAPGKGSGALHRLRPGRVTVVPGDDPWHETSVVRTLWPPQPGTLRWRAEFGDSLVCVRYRHDARGFHRYTTVEILVDHAQVRTLRSGRKAWQLNTTTHAINQRMRRALRQAGAEWDPKIQAWRLSLTMAKQLGVTGQIERVGKSAKAGTKTKAGGS